MSEANADNTDIIINDLYNWIESNGLNIKSNSNLKLIKSTKLEEGRCVLALKDLNYGQVLVEMPDNFVVNYRFALKYPDLVRFFDWVNKTKSNHVRSSAKFNRLDAIYFFLILQRIDKESNMNKFIESMPTSYDTPEYFDQAPIDSMPSLSLKPSVTKRLNKFKKKYQLIVGLLDEFCSIESNQDCKMIFLLKDRIDYDLYKWAFCSVNSRCFHIDEADICTQEEIDQADSLFGKLSNDCFVNDESLDYLSNYWRFKERDEEIKNNLCCLVPFLDFMNHSYQSNALGFYDRELKAFVLKTFVKTNLDDPIQIAIKENQQIYITYGHHDNKTLLIEYGFVLDENPFDRVEFSATHLSEILLKQTTESNEKFFWKSITDQNFISDLSCDLTNGPSWFLLKTLDLVRFLNDTQSQSSSDQDPNDSDLKSPTNKKKKIIRVSANHEINKKNQDGIRTLYLKLLNAHKTDLERSIEAIENQLTTDSKTYDRTQEYHFDMIKRFCNLHLRIIESNLELAKDSKRWKDLF